MMNMQLSYFHHTNERKSHKLGCAKLCLHLNAHYCSGIFIRFYTHIFYHALQITENKIEYQTYFKSICCNLNHLYFNKSIWTINLALRQQRYLHCKYFSFIWQTGIHFQLLYRINVLMVVKPIKTKWNKTCTAQVENWIEEDKQIHSLIHKHGPIQSCNNELKE